LGVVDDGVNKGQAAKGSNPSLVGNGEGRFALVAEQLGDVFKKKERKEKK